MMQFFIVVYIICALAVFLYGISGEKNLLHSFSFALSVNVFPLAFMPELSMDNARIGGIPLAYLPITAAGLAFVFRPWALNTSNIKLAFLMYVFICYLLFNAFYQRFLPATLPYFFSWPVNFAIYLSVFNYFSKASIDDVNNVLSVFFKVLCASCLVGILRYAIGISTDSNFMPLVNRNGTVVFIIMAFPLIFYMLETRQIKRFAFVILWLLFGITLILMYSRSGLIGFFFVTLIYFSRFDFKSIAIGSLISIVTIILIVSPIGNRSFERLAHTQSSVTKVVSGEAIDQGENDYARFMLLKSAWRIFENNIWFGSGIGVPNYRAEFHQHVDFYNRDSKAHNFYLSYLAELGVVGFAVLTLLLRDIYKKLSLDSPKYKAFKVSFLGIAIMMTMNEYILLPELWFFYAMLGGITFALGKRYRQCALGGVQRESAYRISH